LGDGQWHHFGPHPAATANASPPQPAAHSVASAASSPYTISQRTGP
jgi:hypothetical protein